MKPPQTSHAARTATRRAEESEPWNAGAMAAVWEASGQVFYQCSPGAKAMRLHGASRQLLGIAPGTVLEGGRAEWRKQVHPDDLAEVARMDAELAEGEPQTLEYRYIRPEGETVWLRETQCLVRDGSKGRPFLAGTLTDCTEARRMASRLRHYQKMKVFGECARVIAHDCNNLLSIFQGYSELLQAEIRPGAPQSEYLDELLAAVARTRELTQLIHRVSHSRPEYHGPIDCVALLRDLRPMLRRLTQEQIELTLTEKADAAWIKADPQELETLLLNLAVNACEAMPHGGRLEIEISRTPKQACLKLRDTGEGIPKAHLAKIFEPGFTTRKAHGAEGMGLAVCREIAAHSGGRIACKSSPGKGSEFRVTLPALPAPRRRTSSAVPKSQAGRGEAILLVEDDPFVLKALATSLKRLRYCVYQASNGEEALRLLEKNPKIRLVISDVFMPLMSGGELAGIIRGRWPGLPLILTSGYASPVSPEYLKPHETRLFLPKPLATNILARHIRKLIDV